MIRKVVKVCVRGVAFGVIAWLLLERLLHLGAIAIGLGLLIGFIAFMYYAKKEFTARSKDIDIDLDDI